MDKNDLFEYRLPAKIYRRFLILTDAWNGTRAAPGSLLIKVYDGGSGIPFFWCGTPDTLPSFNEQLSQDRSIYCISGIFGVLPPADEIIHALGKYYAAEIIKIQPIGPYLLGGFCQAGYVAYEIANNLQAHGYKLGAFFLFDVDITKTDYWLLIAREIFLTREKIVRRRSQFAVNPAQTIKDMLANKWRQLIILPITWVTKLFRQKALPVNENEQLLETRYKLTNYPGMVNFIYVKWGLLGYFQLRFFQRYWNQYVSGDKSFTIIPGSVHNMPNWSAVAEVVRKIIKESGF